MRPLVVQLALLWEPSFGWWASLVADAYREAIGDYLEHRWLYGSVP